MAGKVRGVVARQGCGGAARGKYQGEDGEAAVVEGGRKACGRQDGEGVIPWCVMNTRGSFSY